MPATEFKFAFGTRVRDEASGYEGVIVSRTEHVGGYLEYGMQGNVTTGPPPALFVVAECRLLELIPRQSGPIRHKPPADRHECISIGCPYRQFRHQEEA